MPFFHHFLRREDTNPTISKIPSRKKKTNFYGKEMYASYSKRYTRNRVFLVAKLRNILARQLRNCQSLWEYRTGKFATGQPVILSFSGTGLSVRLNVDCTGPLVISM